MKLLNSTDMSVKDKMCPYYKDVLKCYPACHCNNPAYKSSMDTAINSTEYAMKEMGITCSLTCGNGEAASHGPFVSYGSKAGAGNYQQAISKMQGPNADPNVRDTRESVLLY